MDCDDFSPLAKNMGAIPHQSAIEVAFNCAIGATGNHYGEHSWLHLPCRRAENQ
jgi:hypothetical protein